MEQDRKAKISARIRALLAKTVENGCTEDEAVAAAAKAAELLDQYDLDMDEVRLRESPFKKHAEVHADAVGVRLWKPASAIAELTGTRYWCSTPGAPPVNYFFFGFDHEVEIATYLMAICARAMRTQMAAQERAFALMTPRFRRRKVDAFLDGMADSLRRRITALRPPKATGTGLVLVRKELIDAELRKRGHKLHERDRSRRAPDDHEAYALGKAAGDAVSLDQAVRGPGGEVAAITDATGSAA